MLWTEVLRAPDGEQPLGQLDGSWIRMGVEQVVAAAQAHRKSQPPVVCNWLQGPHRAVAAHLPILTSLPCGEAAMDTLHSFTPFHSI